MSRRPPKREGFDSQIHSVAQKTAGFSRTIVPTGVLFAMGLDAGSALVQRGRIDALPLQ